MIKQFILFLCLSSLLYSCNPEFEPDLAPVEQLQVNRVEQMSRNPQPWRWKDWAQTARDFDRIAFNYKESGPFFPIIWDDPNARNGFDQGTFGLYTALGDVREGPDINNGENHEAIGAFGALIGATLMGIDKSDQEGRNFVNGMRNYINRDNEWNIVMNFTNKDAHIGGGYGNDWWYDVLNNVLFFILADQYPTLADRDMLLRGLADQFLNSMDVLGDNFSYSYFDYRQMEAFKNHIPAQEDVAAGYAFILYGAYLTFSDDAYLAAAKKAMTVLENQSENRSYEILMSLGPLMAARLNAEAGGNFNIQKLLDWTFDGDAVGREGWGVITGRWGDYDVNGLMGSTVHNGGYGFLMNTFQLAWTLPPLVRYDQRFARSIGLWALNAANSARFCYPDEMPDSLQSLPDRKELAKGVIAYEGLIKESIYPEHTGKTPFAQGDGPLWAPGMPPETQFSIYGSSYVGLFGAVLKQTNVDKIIQIDCTATDFFKKDKAYPTFLYYNPSEESQSVLLDVGAAPVAVYDAVSRRILQRKVNGEIGIDIPADTALVLVLVPSGSDWEVKDGQLLASGVVVDYRYE